ncbi:MAG: T9SS type A sorting domain-containing protein [Calditrichaeota bacterium]|nr:T9SS type A sorting domain-containing protein [Calditrichota bacterium]
MEGMINTQDIAHREDVFLIVADSTGDSLWSRHFGTPDYDFGGSLYCTPQGDIIVAYLVYGDSGTCLLTAFNADGDSLWTRSFGEVNLTTSPNKVFLTQEGEVAITGVLLINQPITPFFWLAKLDSTNRQLWSRTYRDQEITRCRDCIQTMDGGYALLGTFRRGNSSVYNLYLLRTDSDGEILWSQVYDVGAYWATGSIVQTNDDGFAIAATVHRNRGWTDAILIRTDRNGDVLWTQEYDHSFGDDCQCLLELPNTGFILTGHSKSENSDDNDAWIIIVNSQGEMLCSALIGGVGDQFCYLSRFTPDGSLVLGGYNFSGIFPYVFKCWLLKINFVINSTPEPLIFTPHYLSLYSYPNPFNARTTITFDLAASSAVNLTILDPLGRVVQELTPQEWMGAGKHSISADLSNIPAGGYIVRLTQNNNYKTFPIILTK